MGWSTAQIMGKIRYTLAELFLLGSRTFLGSLYIFLLMSNKNLSFLLSNITEGVVNFPKIGAKSSNP